MSFQILVRIIEKIIENKPFIKINVLPLRLNKLFINRGFEP